jgi:hypothetical protein
VFVVGMTVKRTTNPALAVELAAARRRGMIEAADEILVMAAARAPFEEEPRHDVHLRDTGFVRLEAGAEAGDRVAIGFKAFWAVFQHENMAYKHEHGEAKFLERSLIEAEQSAFAIVAESMRAAGMA